MQSNAIRKHERGLIIDLHERILLELEHELTPAHVEKSCLCSEEHFLLMTAAGAATILV
jgi:hypothetical protein